MLNVRLLAFILPFVFDCGRSPKLFWSTIGERLSSRHTTSFISTFRAFSVNCVRTLISSLAWYLHNPTLVSVQKLYFCWKIVKTRRKSNKKTSSNFVAFWDESFYIPQASLCGNVKIIKKKLENIQVKYSKKCAKKH